MKVFVTGVKGQLGSDVIEELKKRGHEAVGVDIEEMDITKKQQVYSRLRQEIPDAVIHCAAWTAVDAAEEIEHQEQVRLVNAVGTSYLAAVCRELDCKLLYLSTDYVFSGGGDIPWRPDCKQYEPLNVYGRTKLEGEQAIASLLSKFFIVRIAWVFGIHGTNFIKTMLRIGKNHNLLTVVDDQIGTPTYTYDLARLLVDMIETEKYGYYHATNEGGYISWHTFAIEIFRQAASLGYSEYDEDHLFVKPVTTKEYGISKARRPLNSRLDRTKLVEEGFTPLPTWQDALHRYLTAIDIDSL